MCCPPQIKAGKKAITHFIDPRTGQEVAIDESAEHMRINLLDPKWKEQKTRMLEKQRGTGLTPGEDIASAMSSLAKARPDIFGGEEFGGSGKEGAGSGGAPGTKTVGPQVRGGVMAWLCWRCVRTTRALCDCDCCFHNADGA